MDPRLTDAAEVVLDRSEVVTLTGPRTASGGVVMVLVKPLPADICAGIMQSWPGSVPKVGLDADTPQKVDQQWAIETFTYPLIEAAVWINKGGELVKAFARDGSAALPMDLLSVEDAAILMTTIMRASGRPIDAPEDEQRDGFPEVPVRDDPGLGDGLGADGLSDEDRADAVAGV